MHTAHDRYDSTLIYPISQEMHVKQDAGGYLDFYTIFSSSLVDIFIFLHLMAVTAIK